MNEIDTKEPIEENLEIDRYLTAKEVANKLRVSMATLGNFRKKKTGPSCHKVGFHYVYPEKELIEYLKSTKIV